MSPAGVVESDEKCVEMGLKNPPKKTRTGSDRALANGSCPNFVESIEMITQQYIKEYCRIMDICKSFSCKSYPGKIDKLSLTCAFNGNNPFMLFLGGYDNEQTLKGQMCKSWDGVKQWLFCQKKPEHKLCKSDDSSRKFLDASFH